MMRKVVLIKFLLSALFLSGQETTVITGFVKNIEVDTLLVAPSHKDLRYSGIEVPVAEGQMFEFNLEHEYIEEYSIVYKSDYKKGVLASHQFFS